MLLVGLVVLGAACQAPQVQGLRSVDWQVKSSYQRQDMLEMQWKKTTFSLLLYQEEKAGVLSMVGLSLTGQPLFELTFDGKQVRIQQRIDAMRLLPFDFLVRDILFATYPAFQPQNSKVILDQSHHYIDINNTRVLDIDIQPQQVVLQNIQVPYSIVFSQIPEGLQ
ncbi:DUF3261 domain-containing protein [Acinetobacter apis]